MIFELIPSALRMATPLGFAALGGIYSERAGVINLALEGMMLIGAFGYIVGAQGSGSTWIGLLVGISCGMAMALLHAVATVTFHAEQVVTGIGINILALGITEYLSPPPEQVGGLPHWQLPLIGSYSFIVYLLPVLMVASHIFLFKTPWGLRLRAAGESTEALAALSLSRAKWQYLGILLSGLLAGAGGCFLASEVHYFTKGMTAGRGYLALAAVIFGNWRPLSGVSACFLFGFATALELTSRWNIPGQLLHSLPYILTMVVLVGFVGTSRPPASLGKMKS
ncbi:MAG: ABC transporter permease [Candidatus Poribacteria bacterium]|nr:ABC transporter permease [Candidatus Poribacteria bacterium]